MDIFSHQIDLNGYNHLVYLKICLLLAATIALWTIFTIANTVHFIPEGFVKPDELSVYF